MAAGGSDLSTRMSTENKSIGDVALSLFKTYKVEISDAINTTFPFLEYLRDHGFITNEIYKDSLQSYMKRCGVQEVIYDVLTKLEKTFDLSLLGALFSKVIMKKYPDLNNIYKIFKTVIPDLELFPECEMEQRPDVQLSLEQGTVTKPLQSLTWLYQDPSNYNGTAPAENGLAEPLRETRLINGNETVPTTSDNNCALETQQANEQCAQESDPAEEELLHHVNQINSCPVDLMNLKKEKPFLNSGVEWQAPARIDGNQASAAIVISSDEDEPTEASTGEQRRNPGRSLDGTSGACSSAGRSLEGASGACSCARRSLEGASGACSSAMSGLEGSSRFSAEAKPPGAFSCAPKSDPNEKGTVDLGNNSTLGKAKKRRRKRNHEEKNVDFSSGVLPVTCRDIKGILYMKRLEQGTTTKCIRNQEGELFSPNEFQVKAGYKKSNDWKKTVRCGGKTLRKLIQEGMLFIPPRASGRGRALENRELCEICQYGENLFCCDTCLRYFHVDCHLPPVDTERSPWSCTFCRMEETLGSRQCLREPEVLARQMGTKEQLKCEFLLLKIYSERAVEMMPHHNYRCMNDLMKLNEIKKKLCERGYPKVEGFMQDVRHIFQGHKASRRCNSLCLGIILEAKFEQNFKEVFAVQ